jgi:cytochrome c peroxidase
LLNDGIGNPKNTKSLLTAVQTPPSMSLGGRSNVTEAIRAGFRHILFTAQPQQNIQAVKSYLQSVRAVPSPYLVHGRLSSAAKRGQRVFMEAGCALCHPRGLFTDQRLHDVGTAALPTDRASDKFDTPTLLEVWRTAPFLHDGSAATIREVLTSRNRNDQHGRTSGLSKAQIEDLCSYVLSL